MRIVKVRVFPNAGRDCVVEESGELKVYVRAPPVEGKANKAVVEILADYFKVKKSAVRMVKGEVSREKVFEINVGEDC
jgi:uncharacterized protein (TIGR00251 family)